MWAVDRFSEMSDHESARCCPEFTISGRGNFSRTNSRAFSMSFSGLQLRFIRFLGLEVNLRNSRSPGTQYSLGFERYRKNVSGISY